MSSFSRTGRLLRLLVRLSCRRPAATIALSLLLAALGVATAVGRLGFETSTRALLPQNAGYVQRYAEYTRDFGELEDIVVVVEAGSFAAARTYADRLATELGQAPVPFPRIAYRVDPKRFEGRHLLFLPTAKLGEVRDRIFDHQDFVDQFAKTGNIDFHIGYTLVHDHTRYGPIVPRRSGREVRLLSCTSKGTPAWKRFASESTWCCS